MSKLGHTPSGAGFLPDRSNGLWRGLMFFWSANLDYNGVLASDFTGNMANKVISGTVIHRFDPIVGYYLDCSAAATRISTGITVDPPSSITVATWMRAPTNGAYQAVVCKWSGTAYLQAYVVYITSAGTIWWVVNDPLGGDQNITTAAVYADNKWHLIVCQTWDVGANSYIRTFVDGRLVAWSEPITGGIYQGAAPLIIGSAADGSQSNPFAGHIADVRIWNRSLRDAEVQRMYDPATRWEMYATQRRYALTAPGPAFKAAWAQRHNTLLGGGVN